MEIEWDAGREWEPARTVAHSTISGPQTESCGLNGHALGAGPLTPAPRDALPGDGVLRIHFTPSNREGGLENERKSNYNKFNCNNYFILFYFISFIL